MAILVKRRGTYYLRFEDSRRTPTRVRFSLRTRRRREAERLKRKFEERDGWDPWTDDPWEKEEALTLHEASQRFLKRKEKEGRSSHTLRTYGMHLRGLRRCLGKKDLKDITAERVERWITSKQLARASQRARYRHARAFFRWCKKEGYLKEIPLRMSEPSQARKLPKALSEEQMELIVMTAYEDYVYKRSKKQIEPGQVIWIIPAIRLAFYTGLRRGELCRLRWDDIDGRELTIRKQKRGFAEVIPLSTKARDLLDRMPKKHPYVIGYSEKRGGLASRMSKAFTRYRRKAGLNQGSFHSLRHGFATHLASRGATAAEIKALMRHSDISTSMRYVSLSKGHLMGRVDDLV
jgi:integrase